MRWMIVFIVAFSLLEPETVFFRPDGVSHRHSLCDVALLRLRAVPRQPGQDEKILVSLINKVFPSSAYAADGAIAPAAHGGRPCLECHRPAAASYTVALDVCTVCHRGHGDIFNHAMAKRSGERQFVTRSWGRFDSDFWQKNCDGCHISSCRDCHDGARITKPTVASCQKCHKGYFTGWDYSGRAPREDNMRYQRGLALNGETFLKMLPDVHYRAGMNCGDCHSMASLSRGERSSKGCRDCHTPSMKPVEHRIAAHLERMECYACHSAWGAQEYGTFFLRFRDHRMKEDFDLRPLTAPDYLRSAYLRRQDAPPLGLNAAGRFSPIRPQFIAFYTDILLARNGGPENTLLAAEWRAWFPHTIQRGSGSCESCHDNPRRYLLELERDRIHLLRKDGLALDSFWSQQGQKMVNGSFVTADHYMRINTRTPDYNRSHVEKWKTFLNRVEHSSRP